LIVAFDIDRTIRCSWSSVARLQFVCFRPSFHCARQTTALRRGDAIDQGLRRGAM